MSLWFDGAMNCHASRGDGGIFIKLAASVLRMVDSIVIVKSVGLSRECSVAADKAKQLADYPYPGCNRSGLLRTNMLEKLSHNDDEI